MSTRDKTPLLQSRASDQTADRGENVDQNVTDTRYLPNSLDPHHTCYLFTDDGKRGQYRSEPRLRNQFEKYIARAKSLTIHGATGEIVLLLNFIFKQKGINITQSIHLKTTFSIHIDVKTPVIVLVVGGDKFTLAKVADCVESGIAVVIVNESGPIPDLLADIYHAFDSKHPQWVYARKSYIPFDKM